MVVEIQQSYSKRIDRITPKMIGIIDNHLIRYLDLLDVKLKTQLVDSWFVNVL